MVLAFHRLDVMILQLRDLLRDLWVRDQAAGLESLRWRLHLRLLLVAAALSGAFALLALHEGRWDPTALGLPLCLGAWAWLRVRPADSRLVARLMVSAFVALALLVLFVRPSGAPARALLALGVMAVFGALLDGLVAGLLAFGVCCVSAVLVLGREADGPLDIVCAFSIPTAACLFLNSLSFSWLYGGLIARRQESAQALRLTSASAEALARTLSEDVTQANARLQQSLASGLDGLEQAAELRQILAQARAQLPAEALHEGPEPEALLEQLRNRVHRFFLWVALGVSATAGTLTYAFGFPLWELGLLLAMLCAMLLSIGDRGAGGWRLRLNLFLLGFLAAVSADTYFAQQLPPAASQVFLPVAAFYAGMLGAPWLAAAAAAAGLALLWVTAQAPVQLPGQGEVLAVLGLLTLALAMVSSLTLPLYRGVLVDLQKQEARLHESLGAYRRLVSTLFHDLANPLAVLQGLASLPPHLRGPEDLPRAQRMVGRLRSVTEGARGAANRRAGQQDAEVRAVAASLRDLFSEAMAQRGLRLTINVPGGLKVRQGGALLDSILGKVMSNALRYGPEGGVLRFSAGRGEGGTWLRLADSGPGFPEETLQDLAAGEAPRPEPAADGSLGAGFSLSLATGDALDLGGRLTLSNPAEGGAQAELWLPD